jgi:transketolase
MGLEDISMFRSIPNSIILYPSDPISMEHAVYLTSHINNISYIRSTRGTYDNIYHHNDTFNIGHSKIIKSSNHDKLTILAAGVTLHSSLSAY